MRLNLRLVLYLTISFTFLSGCNPEGTTVVDSLIEETNIVTGTSENKTITLPFHTVVKRDSDQIISLIFPAHMLNGLHTPTLLTSRAGSNIQVFVDDEWVYGQSFLTRRMAHTWNTPQLVSFSKNQINSAQFIRIKLFAFAGDHTLLDPIYLGEHETLAKLFYRFGFFQNDLTLAISVATLVLLFISLLLWFASGGDRNYLMAIGSSAMLIIACLNYFVINSYLSHSLIQTLTHSALDWFGVFIALWIMHIKQFTKKYNSVLYFWGFFCSFINLVLPPNWIVPFVEWLHFITIGGVLLALLAPANKNSNRSEVATTMVTGVIGCCLSLLDLLIQFRIIQAPGLPRIVPILFFCIFISNNVILLNRFTRTYKIARRSQKELESIVTARESEIDRQYARTANLEALRVRTEERARIMRDIHDGMGGHLVSALAVAEHDPQLNNQSQSEIKKTLKAALGEMRFLLSNSVEDTSDFGEALGSLRTTLEPLLQQANIELKWEVDPFGAMPILTISERMHVIRVVQECITNILKHTHATKVTLSTCRVDENYLVQIKDNGSGQIAPGSGHGIENMKFRANELGGYFDISKAQNETRATLTFPFERL